MTDFELKKGKDKGKVILYALSTCIWCKKTKKLLDELGVEYSYIYMDDVEGEVKDKFKKQHAAWNPKCSYPTLIINDQECIVGFEEDKIRRLLSDE
jgi:glutaredoxin-like protein NrdH